MLYNSFDSKWIYFHVLRKTKKWTLLFWRSSIMKDSLHTTRVFMAILIFETWLWSIFLQICELPRIDCSTAFLTNHFHSCFIFNTKFNQCNRYEHWCTTQTSNTVNSYTWFWLFLKIFFKNFKPFVNYIFEKKKTILNPSEAFFYNYYQYSVVVEYHRHKPNHVQKFPEIPIHRFYNSVHTHVLPYSRYFSWAPIKWMWNWFEQGIITNRNLYNNGYNYVYAQGLKQKNKIRNKIIFRKMFSSNAWRPYD